MSEQTENTTAQPGAVPARIELEDHDVSGYANALVVWLAARAIIHMIDYTATHGIEPGGSYERGNKV